jgi:hypothetical protein
MSKPNRGTRAAALRLLANNLWRPGLAAAVADALGQGFGEALHESAPEGILALRLVVETLGQQAGRDGFAGDPSADSALQRMVQPVTWDSNQVIHCSSRIPRLGSARGRGILASARGKLALHIKCNILVPCAKAAKGNATGKKLLPVPLHCTS